MTEATVLAAVASEQPAECPAWCAYTDDGCDARNQPMYEDRHHYSSGIVVALSTEEPQRSMRVRDGKLEEYFTDEPQQLCARLDQHYREAQPRIRVYGDESSPLGLSLTLDEAEEFARGILALIDEARCS
jgi:hypothetical protein